MENCRKLAIQVVTLGGFNNVFDENPKTNKKKDDPNLYYDNFIRDTIGYLRKDKIAYAFNKEQVERIVATYKGELKITKEDSIYTLKVVDKKCSK